VSHARGAGGPDAAGQGGPDAAGQGGPVPCAAASPPHAAVLAIDGGNSKTDLTLVGFDGALLAQVRGPGVNAQINGVEPTIRMLGGLVAAAAREAGLREAGTGAAAEGGPAPVAAHTSACLANADLPEEEEELCAALAAQGWSVSTTLLNDTFAVLRAGLDGEENWGVAVTCGAGINCVGVAPDGRAARFLALGEITGDWGGGGELARQALWWAIRAEDGRGPQTLLREAVCKHFGAAEVRDVAIGIHRGSIGWAELLGLARVLLAVADGGDEVAGQVVRRLADEVCVMALTAMRRLGLTEAAVPVVLGGSLLAAASPLLTSQIAAGLAAGAPGAQMRITEVPPVAGAALLGLDHVAARAGAQDRLREAYRG
jgi:N-acetylglucosamine kinase-like BadF-type ATPase